MSLAGIKNPWVRRPLTVVAVIFYTPLALVASLFTGAADHFWTLLTELPAAIAAAWRGPKVQV